jgi:hypothetical protein
MMRINVINVSKRYNINVDVSDGQAKIPSCPHCGFVLDVDIHNGIAACFNDACPYYVEHNGKFAQKGDDTKCDS